MPKRFYAAWALVVVLVAVLPIAVPYFIWPPYHYERGSFVGPDQAEVFGRYAQSRIGSTKYLPTSLHVDVGPELQGSITSGCGPARLHRLERDYTATVTTRGPYGIPIGSVEVDCERQYPQPGVA